MIRIGSRGSDLALWQAHFTQDLLKKQGIDSEIIIIKTQGDQIQHLSFSKMEGKGFFTKEIEEALLNNSIDLAVHSHKDLPTENPEGLIIGAVSYRENCADVLIVKPDFVDESQLIPVKKGARIGTSSVRRKAQLAFFRDDIETVDLRGNVPTRIQKLDLEMYDAIVLAQAGVNRLNIDLSRFRCFSLSPELFVPAPAQGVLAYQIRENDAPMAEVVKLLHHNDVAEHIYIERKTLNLFDGGCQLPLGVYCDSETVYAAILPLDGKPFRRLALPLSETNPEKLKASLLKTSNKKVFISRAASDAQLFSKTLQAYGCEVIAESLIEIKPLEKNPISIQADWIFFSSAHGVEHGLHLLHQLPNAKVGAVGSATAQHIIKAGFSCAFVGKDSKTSSEIGHDFSLIAEGMVVFPESLNGNKTIQKNNHNRYEAISVPVYETIEKQLGKKPEADVYAFTSPSNVKSFVNQFGKPTGDVFAIGDKTAEALIEYGITKVKIAQQHSMQNLADTIAGMI